MFWVRDRLRILLYYVYQNTSDAHSYDSKTTSSIESEGIRCCTALAITPWLNVTKGDLFHILSM
jgi:hypothetical protein